MGLGHAAIYKRAWPACSHSVTLSLRVLRTTSKCVVESSAYADRHSIFSFRLFADFCAQHKLTSEVTYSESAEKSFRNVGDDDADEEDDGVEPVVVERQCDEKERHSEADGEDRYEVNKLLDFAADWSLVLFDS